MRTLCRRTRRKMITWIRTWLERRRSIFDRFWRTVLWLWPLFLETFCCIVSRVVLFPRRALLWLNGGGNEVEEDEDDPQSDPEGERETPVGDENESDSKEYVVDDTDELYCNYDSTWETKQSQDPPKSRKRSSDSASYNQYRFSRFKNAARDMFNYRHDYPLLNEYHSTHDDMLNLKFYCGEEPCVPDGVYISEIHDKWWGNYYKLESVHTYIQWLFPLQEPGMNYQASTLTKQEIQDFCENTQAKQNLLRSYKLMLDFYGIELEETTGAVKRAMNWKDRFDNLNSRTHNNLRLTRILKCLGTLGYPHYQAPLVHFFLEETLVHGELPNVKESVLNYFVFAVLDKKERRKLIKFAYTNYTPKMEFVWCPKKIQEVWSRTQDGASGAASDHDGEARNNEHNELTGAYYNEESI